MDVGETKCSYGKPPWIFRGSALYQLHLVKAATVRACIPKEFRLVEAFGYTLGGFFLAKYDDSPVGIFDELVVIAGLVWSPPTSCAWAAKVLVNSDEACDHGRKEVGLPSQVARFSKRITAVSRQPKSKNIGFLSVIGSSAAFCDPKDCMEVQVTEIKASSVKDSFNFNLTTFVPESNGGWRGPAIKLSLPSFSGGTEYYPNLLKYSCRIECSVLPDRFLIGYEQCIQQKYQDHLRCQRPRQDNHQKSILAVQRTTQLKNSGIMARTSVKL
ncbi:protein NEOXANTHIN-DEFICIENT 1-like isoform X4 [Malus domestica]